MDRSACRAEGTLQLGATDKTQTHEGNRVRRTVIRAMRETEQGKLGPEQGSVEEAPNLK